MKAAALVLLLALAPAAWAEPEEDAAHRADRLRTAALNRSVARATARHASPDPDAQQRYRAAREQYGRALADWRARVEACEGGDWDACR